ncbi:MAG TPA: ABC transporter permease [Vicinamibacterales bacterium]|jgi:ABC-type polysaccharide/polyol phosphate export permease|nr:ABC transporter permease [Vicinamibacterales bacterium]
MLRNLSQLPRYRALIQSLVARELKARYRGSVLGFFWSFINPLLLLLIYTFVFKYVMPAQPEGTDPYPLFMFCGLLPWTWFSASLIESSGVLISGGNLIKKVLFPAEILPIVTVTANMVHFFLALPILVVFLIWFRAPLTVFELAWFPVVVLVQYVFTLGCALILSALTVHFRDIRDILANLLTLWFFATPIIYSYKAAPDLARRFMNLNPFAHLAISYQEILFFPGPFGHWKWLVALGVASAAFFLFGYFVFDRLRDSFAEEV